MGGVVFPLRSYEALCRQELLRCLGEVKALRAHRWGMFDAGIHARARTRIGIGILELKLELELEVLE